MTFYFYDLETSSGSPRTGRIMQFAGQRTDADLQPIGEPDNILVKLADDIIPEPDAVLVHGITPQKTLEEGLTEAEFAEFFHENIALANTVFVGFNNIRFDDEFIRRMCYRTFNDPYQWHWLDGRSRWDLLDPIRMMRALRPEGLKWPMLKDKPTVKLELMAQENGLTHDNAHDALSDVIALIELAQKFKHAQPKLFEYLVRMRDKKAVGALLGGEHPFVYTSGSFGGTHLSTTVACTLFAHPRRKGSSIVYDLRHDPTRWFGVPPKELARHWQARFYDNVDQLPVKTVQHNKCPAVAPLGVLDNDAQTRLEIDLDQIKKHWNILLEHPEFAKDLEQALDIIENEQQSRLPLNDTVDTQMYDGFWADGDYSELNNARLSPPEGLSKLIAATTNKRIRDMIPLYKARNFPKTLTDSERADWEQHRRGALTSGGEKSPLARYYKRMEEIKSNRKLNDNDEYLLTELQLYVESIVPEPEDGYSQE